MPWIQYCYPEIAVPSGKRPSPFPTLCPMCGARNEFASYEKYAERAKYACGGEYSRKPQIQNHTDKWWGMCPVKREAARLEHGLPCERCGERSLAGTGLPVGYHWKCEQCGHDQVRKD